MTSKIKQKLVTLGAIAVVIGGVYGWNWFRTVNVEISAFNPESKIELMAAKSVKMSAYSNWIAMQPGENRLVKGAYYYRLSTAGVEKTGLIAVENQAKIVLK